MINNTHPLVSVIMPAYNSGVFIEKTIGSVTAQTYADIELIIIDDGSTDRTVSVLKKCMKADARIRYFCQKNKGPAAARNKGIKEARGQIIAFLDSDDLCMPDRIERQMKVLTAEPWVGLVFCRTKLKPRPKTFLKDTIVKNLLTENYVGSASNVMVKKECFDKVGLFDESLAVAEDWDMWLRIAQKFECRYIDKTLVKIRIRAGSQSYYGGKNLDNELRFLEKVYKSDDFKNNKLEKVKAYSRCYYRAAIAYKENGDLAKAKECFGKTLADLSLLLDRKYLTLLFRFAAGEKVFRLTSKFGRKHVFSNV